MPVIIDLKFGENGRVFGYDASNFQDLKKGDQVIASFSDCLDFATAVSNLKEIKNFRLLQGVQSIERKATQKDVAFEQKVIEKSKQAFPKVLGAIQKFELSMKLVEVRFSFDETKLFISYTAESRVDFRELVKFLATIFKVRVELRQLNPREEAKMLGGCGSCGKPFCCATFLGANQNVSVKMSKTQNLSLNPSKINGPCGKLLCCIAFENEQYQEVLDKMPPLNSIVSTPKGEGEVVFQDILKEKVTVKFVQGEETSFEDFSLEELKVN